MRGVGGGGVLEFPPPTRKLLAQCLLRSHSPLTLAAPELPGRCGLVVQLSLTQATLERKGGEESGMRPYLLC